VKFADPIISYAIAPKNKGDEEKISASLHRVLEEDPTLRFSRDEETKEMLISGMGQVHIEVTLERLKRRFGVEIEMKTPKIPYRETIRSAAKVQGKYKKQSGGKGQYGDCHSSPSSPCREAPALNSSTRSSAGRSASVPYRRWKRHCRGDA
jgi:elongation factor G